MKDARKPLTVTPVEREYDTPRVVDGVARSVPLIRWGGPRDGEVMWYADLPLPRGFTHVEAIKMTLSECHVIGW